MKSPNMMRRRGRKPATAAPTASPVKPASEMGVSSTRSLPNSSTRPESTLNGVPASATSSPIMQTVLSRRISSARASRMACAKVNSRPVVSGIDILLNLIDIRIGRSNREFHGRLHFDFQFVIPSIHRRAIDEFLLLQKLSEVEDRVPLRLPGLFFLLRAVIFAVDVADMVAVVAEGVAEEKCWDFPFAGSANQFLRDARDPAHILAVHV